MAQKLDEQIIMDLADAATKKVHGALMQTLQLVDDNDQRMVIATHVAAGPFAMAARFMQQAMREKNGAEPPWEDCVASAVKFVAKLALENPPGPLPQLSPTSAMRES